MDEEVYMERTRDAIEFKIVESIAVLGAAGKDWSLELNLVSWNGREPKYDIRSWDPTHQRMGKGVTLSAGEAAALSEALKAHLSKEGA